MQPVSRIASLAPWFLAFAFGATPSAQCTPQWLPGDSVPGPIQSATSHTISAMTMWDPDGGGPASPLLVLGGTFSIPVVGATNLATFDLTTHRWGAFAAQPNGSVYSIKVMANGDLVIGGNFTAVGQMAAGGVARWDGASWSALAGGVAGSVYAVVSAMQPLPNGDLVVAGGFASAGGVAAQGIARWDGSQWWPLGSGVQGVNSLALRANGNLVVGGTFVFAGGVSAPRIAQWNGTAWSAMGTGMNWEVYAVAELQNGDVVASGQFLFAGGVPVQNIARWDGTAWHAMNGVDGRPRSLLVLPNGDLLAGTIDTVLAGPVLGVARWDGSQWTPHATLVGGIISCMVTTPTGDLLVGGNLTSAGNVPASLVARWDGTTWHGLTRGFDNTVRGFVNLPNGDFVALGSFRRAEGATINYVGRHDGQGWWSLGTWGGSNVVLTNPTCALYHPEHELLVGNADNQGVRRWDGTSWQPFGTTLWGGGIEVMAMLPDRQVVVAGTLQLSAAARNIVRWSGSAWVAFGSGLDAPVHALLVRGNGDLIAGGEFLNSGSTPIARVARWDGTAWQPLGAGFDGPVRSLVELPNGELIAGGDFTASGAASLSHVARWNGNTWSPLGPGLSGAPTTTTAHALLVLPNGDVLAGGDFTTAGGAAASNVARWDGSTWQAVDGGIEGTVLALALDARGDVVAGGEFVRAGGHESAYFARLRSPCAASAATYGTSCSGALGPVELAAESLPWLGAAARATCFGVPTQALALEVYGFQPVQVALSQLHPLGGPGCLLLTAADAINLRVPGNGAVSTALFLPNDLALSGLVVHQQLLVAEFDVNLTFTHLGGSNGLRWTLGFF